MIIIIISTIYFVEPECLQDYNNTNSANTEELTTLKQHVGDLINTLRPYFPTGMNITCTGTYCVSILYSRWSSDSA